MFECVIAPDSLSQFDAWNCWKLGTDILQSKLLFGYTVHTWGRIGKSLQACAALTVLIDIIGAPAIRNFGTWLTSVFTLAQAKIIVSAGFQLFVDVIVRQLGDLMFRITQLAALGSRLVRQIKVFIGGNLRDRERVARMSTCIHRILRVALFSRKGIRAKRGWREKRLPLAVKVEAFEEKYVVPIIGLIALAFAGFIIYINYKEGFPHGVSYAIFLGVIALFLTGIAYAFASIIIRLLLALLIFVFISFSIIIDSFILNPVAWLISHPRNDNLIKGISLIVFAIGFYFDLLAS